MTERKPPCLGILPEQKEDKDTGDVWRVWGCPMKNVIFRNHHMKRHYWTTSVNADDFNSFAHQYFNCVSFISHSYTNVHCLKFYSFLNPPDGKYAALPRGETPHCCRWQGGVTSEHQIHPPGTSDICNATSSVSVVPPPPACHRG
jgi:hypothetical protein